MGTWNYKKMKLGHCTVIFVAICYMLSYAHADGRSISSRKTLVRAITGTIKTIQGEDGDVIDCVDIYKQPAFNHPFLKNHTIQMKPSSYPRGMEVEPLEPELLQDWHKNEECPEGTIPILRSPQHSPKKKTSPFSPSMQLAADDPRNHEYAQVSVPDGNYFGASARFNVWKPATYDGEFSLAQMWIVAGRGNELNTMEAGWQVLHNTGYTRLFIYWTSDGYQTTGCYNLECAAFVQTSSKLILGGRIGPLSSYAGKQFQMSFYIHKDKESGNWWLRITEIDVGYWPSTIFPLLFDRAEKVAWGGEIINLRAHNRHTATQMGSGEFPSEGFGKASYIRNLRLVAESRDIYDAQNLTASVSRPECYDLQMGNIKNFGTHIFYGGPGYSDKCV